VRLQSIVVALIAVLTLIGCGSSDSDKPAATSTAETSNADADVESGCWKAADRVEATGENNTVAGQLQWDKPPAMTIDPAKNYTATITTNKGSFKVEFYPDEAPKTVNNFICLAKAGYYDNSPFHRIIAGFVIQGGDPTGTGRGGPGYRFEDEKFNRNYELGSLAMANAGPNTNGSQFFILTGQNGTALPKNYTLFGKVIEGMDVVNTIANTPVKVSPSGEKSSPIDPVIFESVTVEES
jgi:cyclophilin family peptidyl-prolyl cis-trans isomerase